MSISLSVKLLSLLFGVSLVGMLSSVFYKVLLYKQFKRLEKESRQVFQTIQTKISRLVSGGLDEQEKKIKEELSKKEEVSKEDRKRIDALLQGIDEKIASEAYDDAERHLVEALGIDPTNEDVNSLLAFVYMKQQKYTKAENIYTELITQGTEDPSVYSNLGKVLEEQGHLDTASYAYKEAVLKAPDEPKRYVTLAEIYVKMSKPDMAVPLIEEVVRMTDSIEYRFTLADLFGKLSEAERQVLTLKEIIEIDPANEEAKQRLAILRS